MTKVNQNSNFDIAAKAYSETLPELCQPLGYNSFIKGAEVGYHSRDEEVSQLSKLNSALEDDVWDLKNQVGDKTSAWNLPDIKTKQPAEGDACVLQLLNGQYETATYGGKYWVKMETGVNYKWWEIRKWMKLPD